VEIAYKRLRVQTQAFTVSYKNLESVLEVTLGNTEEIFVSPTILTVVFNGFLSM
jgi:hypothetical protein